jgi:hypothetical protein
MSIQSSNYPRLILECKNLELRARAIILFDSGDEDALREVLDECDAESRKENDALEKIQREKNEKKVSEWFDLIWVKVFK